ncbi:hypothetical protein HMPREF9954_1542 [Streptococcus infantis SK970]|nr:hypothetical protein HMPREF9954_1542 [Streptococcus infantis SK970]
MRDILKSFLYLHKLGDKDHDDDDWNDETKKEKPDLEKYLSSSFLRISHGF